MSYNVENLQVSTELAELTKNNDSVHKKCYNMVDKFEWFPNEYINDYIKRITEINFVNNSIQTIVLENAIKQLIEVKTEILNVIKKGINEFTEIQTTFETIKVNFDVQNVKINHEYSKEIDFDKLANVADDLLMYITTSTINMDSKLSNFLTKIEVDTYSKS
jgi:hypothetical protein